MSKEQFTPQPNHRDNTDDLTALVDAVREAQDLKNFRERCARQHTAPSVRTPMALDKGELHTKNKDIASANRRADKEISATPEKSNKSLPTKIAVGILAVAMAMGGALGLSKLTEKTAFAETTIYDPHNAREQICDIQAKLEEHLGLPKSNSYDALRGCEGTASMVTKTEEGLNPGDRVRVTVITDAIGEAAIAEKVEKPE